MVSDTKECSACNRIRCGPRHHRCCRTCPDRHTTECRSRQQMVQWLVTMRSRRVRLQRRWQGANPNKEEFCWHCNRFACGPRHFRCCRRCHAGNYAAVTHTHGCVVRQNFCDWFFFSDIAEIIFKVWENFLLLFFCALRSNGA